MPAERRKKSSKPPKEKRNETEDKTTDQLPEQPHGFRWGATIRHSIMRMIVIGVLIYTLQVVYNKDLPSLAKQDEEIEARIFDRNCSKDYREDRKKFKECAPHHCGRGVMDQLVSKEEAQILLEVAKSGFAYGGSTGGASILDLHTGALSLERLSSIFTSCWSKMGSKTSSANMISKFTTLFQQRFAWQ